MLQPATFHAAVAVLYIKFRKLFDVDLDVAQDLIHAVLELQLHDGVGDIRFDLHTFALQYVAGRQ